MGLTGSARLGGGSRRGGDEGAVREVGGEPEFGSAPPRGREVRGDSTAESWCIGVCVCFNRCVLVLIGVCACL